MSEINDAVQIIRVGYEGVDIAIKLGAGGIEFLQKTVDLLVGLLKYEKTMGKTNLKTLLEKGGDIQILSFADEDMKKFKKLAKKYGILYSVMPKTDKKDGMREVMFHSEAAPRVSILCKKLSKGRMFQLDEFLKSGNEEQLNRLLDFLEKQKGNRKLHTDEAARADVAIQDLIQKVGMYVTEKQSVSVEAVKKDFHMDTEQAKDILGQLEKIGVLKKADGMDQYHAVMDTKGFESRMEKYRELSDRMRQIAASKNTNLLDITITKKLIEEENDHACKTRVPGMYGDKEGYIWLNKKDIMEIHDGKTLLTYIDKNKEYKIYSKDNRVLYTMKGGELYNKHYDKVENAVRKHYEKVKDTKQSPVKAPHTKRR